MNTHQYCEVLYAVKKTANCSVENGKGIFSSFCKKNRDILLRLCFPSGLQTASGHPCSPWRARPRLLAALALPGGSALGAAGSLRGRGRRRKRKGGAKPFAKQAFTNNMNLEKHLGIDNFR
jgi:hypothetical protein